MLKKLNRITAKTNRIRPIKVLQFGDGNFLRGFADWMIDVLNEKTDFNGDVRIIRPQRKGQPEIKDDQDGLYHVVLNGLQNGRTVTETRLITCVAGSVNPYSELDLFLREAENPNLLFIISNTTEAGIVFNPHDLNPDVVHESFPAKATMLLYHRFTSFQGDPTKGVIFIPCELIEKNGDALKKAMLEYSRLWKLNPDFDKWLTVHNTFCNSLVDRIVTGFPK
ncbi:MAG: altronate oxidoreductase, partial [Marivirga sp.]|nr:altronate oxidoreductase [Marivirga sp.]